MDTRIHTWLSDQHKYIRPDSPLLGFNESTDNPLLNPAHNYFRSLPPHFSLHLDDDYHSALLSLSIPSFSPPPLPPSLSRRASPRLPFRPTVSPPLSRRTSSSLSQPSPLPPHASPTRRCSRFPSFSSALGSRNAVYIPDVHPTDSDLFPLSAQTDLSTTPTTPTLSPSSTFDSFSSCGTLDDIPLPHKFNSDLNPCLSTNPSPYSSRRNSVLSLGALPAFDSDSVPHLLTPPPPSTPTPRPPSLATLSTPPLTIRTSPASTPPFDNDVPLDIHRTRDPQTEARLLASQSRWSHSSSSLHELASSLSLSDKEREKDKDGDKDKEKRKEKEKKGKRQRLRSFISRFSGAPHGFAGVPLPSEGPQIHYPIAGRRYSQTAPSSPSSVERFVFPISVQIPTPNDTTESCPASPGSMRVGKSLKSHNSISSLGSAGAESLRLAFTRKRASTLSMVPATAPVISVTSPGPAFTSTTGMGSSLDLSLSRANSKTRSRLSLLSFRDKSRNREKRASRTGSGKGRSKRILVVNGLALDDVGGYDAVKAWCEEFGEVRNMSRKENGSLHIDFCKWSVADTVCRIQAQVHIKGAGSVSLSWYTKKGL